MNKIYLNSIYLITAVNITSCTFFERRYRIDPDLWFYSDATTKYFRENKKCIEPETLNKINPGNKYEVILSRQKLDTCFQTYVLKDSLRCSNEAIEFIYVISDSSEFAIPDKNIEKIQEKICLCKNIDCSWNLPRLKNKRQN